MSKERTHSTPPAGGVNASVPQSVYQKHLLRARAGGNYFLFFRNFVRILGKVDALLLQDLINHAAHLKQDDDGFFLCTRAYLERSLCWTRHEQNKHLARLAEKGFIVVKKMGVPGRRYIKVCVESIEKALDDLEEDKGSSCPRSRTTSRLRSRTTMVKKRLRLLTRKNNRDAPRCARGSRVVVGRRPRKRSRRLPPPLPRQWRSP